MRAIFKIDIRELYARQSEPRKKNTDEHRHRQETIRHVRSRAGVSILPGVRRPARGAAAEGRRSVAARLHDDADSSCISTRRSRSGTVITRRPMTRIVLVRRAIEPGYGLWVFPGGYVDRGEEVTVAALREAREEAGLQIRLDGLINIYSYPGRPIIIVVYQASIVGGEPARSTRSPSKRGCFPAPRFRGTSSHSGARGRRSTTISAGLVHPIR